MPVVNFEYIIHTVYIYIYTSYACAYIENMQRLYPNIPVLSPADWANGCALPLVDDKKRGNRVTHQIARVDI